MKKLDTYKKLGLTCDNLVFDYFFDTITPVIHNLSFYVNWENIFSGVECSIKAFEILGLLNPKLSTN